MERYLAKVPQYRSTWNPVKAQWGHSGFQVVSTGKGNLEGGKKKKWPPGPYGNVDGVPACRASDRAC